MILYHHPALRHPLRCVRESSSPRYSFAVILTSLPRPSATRWGLRPLSQRYSFAVILTSLPRPSATPSNRRGIRRGIKRSCKAMLRCCVRGPGRRLGGAGLCGCTYRRLDFLPTFSSRKKLEKKKSERIFAYFPSVESMKKIVDINLF